MVLCISGLGSMVIFVTSCYPGSLVLYVKKEKQLASR